MLFFFFIIYCHYFLFVFGSYVNPAMTAPAPIVISSAGKAQQSRVDVLANRESVGPMSVRRSMGFIPP